MARLAGKAGQVDAAAEVVGVKSWTIDYEYDVLESTAFDSAGVKAFLPAGSGWSGSFEGHKDGAPLTIGTEVALALKESQTATQKFTGQAIIKGLHAVGSHDGLITYSYDFQGTGVLTIPTA